jgi:hypothetical protein
MVRCSVIALLSSATLAPSFLSAQDSTVVRSPVTASVVTMSGDSVDRWRLNQILDTTSTTYFMLRSASRVMFAASAQDTASTSFFRGVLPRIDLVNNSALPYGENDGALWAGKGSNVRIIGGVQASAGVFRLLILPEYVSSQNRPFDYTQLSDPGLLPGRKLYSSPWNGYPYSIDAPVRFGAGRTSRIAPGQSAAYVALRNLETGVATDNEWWGPGIRSAILMSDNAEGFPRAFLRTARPWETRAGAFEATWMWGGLTESSWFDNDPGNDLRSLSAAALTWSPALERDLTVGLGRSVFAPAGGWGEIARRPFDAFASTGRPNARAVSDTAFRPGRDQILSLFGRWVFPGSGFETYAEWARAEMPRSFRDFLLAPDNTQGYTVGLQWARPAGPGAFRIQAEHTYIEQSPTFRDRPLGSFYTSRAVIQGYTNRGQVIGAGMGQGSSGEWLALDYLRRGWQAGAFGARTRFNNDAYYLLPLTPGQGHCQHDLSLSPGFRAAVPTPLGRISLKYTSSERLNAYFQNLTACTGVGPKVDLRNHTLQLSFVAGR